MATWTETQTFRGIALELKTSKGFGTVRAGRRHIEAEVIFYPLPELAAKRCGPPHPQRRIFPLEEMSEAQAWTERYLSAPHER